MAVSMADMAPVTIWVRVRVSLCGVADGCEHKGHGARDIGIWLPLQFSQRPPHCGNILVSQVQIRGEG